MDEKKVAFITGGTRGIGKAIAKIFSDNGYNLVINYVSEKTDLKKLEDDLKNDNEILFVRANVGEFDSAENAVKKAIEKFGKIDVLVNNAGITRDNLIMRMKEEEFDQVINTNLKVTTREVQNRLSFVNISM